MRNVLIALFLCLVASCAHTPRGGTGSRDVHDSVYQVRVTLTVDTSPLFPSDDESKGGEEGKSKVKAKKSLYMPIDTDAEILPFGEHTGKVGWLGTGWVAANVPGRSFVMTAGHVCESGNVYQYTYLDWSKFQMVTVDLPIIAKEHILVSSDGVEIPSSIVRDEDLDDDFNGNDLCMLGAAGYLGPAIPVATDDPDRGEICDVVGAPRGLWGGGVSPASDAKFSGRGSVFGVDPDGLSFNGNMAPGNSGSAVTCDGHAVGVISLGSPRFPSLIHAVPYERIRAFMRKALHRKP